MKSIHENKELLGPLLSIERFLEFCEETAQGVDGGIEESLEWKTSETFHRYIEILEDRIEELMLSVGNSRDDWDGRLLGCKRRVGILSDMLEPVNAKGERGGDRGIHDALKIIKEHSDGSPANLGMLQDDIHAKRDAQKIIKKGDIAENRKPSFRPITISDAAKSRLEKESQVQEALTDDLADMASALKESTRGVQNKVLERDALLDATEGALETSVQGTKTSVTRIEKARKKSRMNFCFTMMVILLLVLGCAAMVVFIRITSLVGYKRQRVQTTEL